MQPAELGKPIRAISIDLTETCSLRCTYCFCDTLADKTGNNHLSFETGKDIIDWLYDDKVSGNEPNIILHIDWWGGEPFTQFQMMKDLVAYCNQKTAETNKQITFSVTTNIVSLNEEKINFAVDNQFAMMYSLDGIGERNSERLTKSGENSWPIIEKILPVIVNKYKQMVADKLQHQPGPTFRMTVSPTNIKGLREDCKYLIDLGVESIVCSENFDTDWTEEQYNLLFDEYCDIVDMQIEYMKQGKSCKIKIIDKILEKMCHYIGTGIGNIEEYACGAGNTYLGISIRGGIFPCHRCNKHNTLQVNDTEKDRCLGTIYDGITNFALNDHLTHLTNFHTHEDTVLNIDKCKTCEYNQLCLGLHCFSITKDREGIWNKSTEEQCRIFNIRAKVAEQFLTQLTATNRLNQFKDMMGIQQILENKTFVGSQKANCLCNASFYEDTVGVIKHQFLQKRNFNDKTTILLIARDLIDKKILQESADTNIPSFLCQIYNALFSEDDTRKLNRNLTPDEEKEVINTLSFIFGNT